MNDVRDRLDLIQEHMIRDFGRLVAAGRWDLAGRAAEAAWKIDQALLDYASVVRDEMSR